MKIAYLHRVSFPESEKRFAEEAEKLGVELVLIKYRQLRLEGERILFGNQDLADFDGWYFRAVGTELEWAKLLEIYAKKHGIKVVDEYLLAQGPLRRFKSVMGVQLIKAGVSYPRTAMVESLADLKQDLIKWQFPLVVKMSQGGRHGMGTFWLRRQEDLVELEGKLPANSRGFLIQEYLPNDGDYRILVVGYRCVGGFKRGVKEEKLVMNKSVGKSVRLETVPEEVTREAEKAAMVLGVEVAGIDLVKEKTSGRVYIIEVNEAPQFKVFEKRTGINAAGRIIEYLVGKFGGRKKDGRVLILGRFVKEYEPKRLLEEARKTGEADLVKYGQVKLTEAGADLGNGKKLSNYDLIVPRSASKKGSSLVATKAVILEEARRLGVRVVNGVSFEKYPLLGKTEQGRLLAAAGLPTAPFVAFASKKGWEDLKVSFPVMVKGRFGSHGRAVRLVRDKKELEGLVREYKEGNVLIQPVLPIKVWFRVIVCGGEYLGQMRHKQKEKYAVDSSQFPVEKEEERDMERLRKISLAAADLFGCDYCGIDVGWDEEKGDWVIFEVNRTAQFQYFEKRTGVNVAEKILAGA